MRDIAADIGITERAVQRIVDELVEAGFVSIRKSGRRNVYALNTTRTLPAPLPVKQRVEELLKPYAA